MAQTTALLGGGTDEGSSSFCGAEDEEKKDFLLSGASSEKAAKGALDPLKRARWPSTAFGLLAVMFGATQLPYSLGQMGWTYGLLAVGLSGVSTWASGLLIGRAAIATGAKSYPELGKKAFGPTGRRIIVAAQWMSYFLTGMTQIAFSGATYQQTFKGTKLQNVCTQGWMLVTTCLLAPCLMVPSFNDAVGLTVFVVSVQCFGLAIMYSQIAEEGRYSSAGLCYDKITRDSILATVANTAFAFGGHGVIPELIREMKQPKDFSKAFNVAYGFTVPMYVLSGAVGFWAWGNASSANFVENLKSTPWVKAYNWINTVGTFPLVVVNQVALFLNVELSFGILPTDVWVNSNRPKRMKPTTKRLGNNHPPELGGPHHGPHHGPPHGVNVVVVDEDENGSYRTEDDDALYEEGTLVEWLSRFPPVVVRAVFRVGYIFTMYAAAYALVGIGLGNLTDLTGALGICALTYWMPFVIHAKVFWNQYTARGLAWNALNIAFGLFVSAAGTFFAAKDLFSGSFTFFHESSCKEGAYFWGNDLWGQHVDHAQLHKPLNGSSPSAVYDIIVDGCCHRAKTCGQ